MFKIGDKVIIIKHYKRPERLGTITTVIDFGVYHIYPGGMWYGCSDVKPGDLCIFLDLEP